MHNVGEFAQVVYEYVETLARNIDIVIIGNKKDLEKQREVTSEDVKVTCLKLEVNLKEISGF